MPDFSLISKLGVPVLILSLIIGAYFYGKAEGKSLQKHRCETKLFKLNSKSISERDKHQADVDGNAKKYEDYKQQADKRMATFKRRFADATATKLISTCPASAAFVQLYRESTGFDTSAKGKVSP